MAFAGSVHVAFPQSLLPSHGRKSVLSSACWKLVVGLVVDHPNLGGWVSLCSSLPPLVDLFLPFPGELPTSKTRGSEIPEGIFSLWPRDQAVQTAFPKACQNERRGRHRGSRGIGCRNPGELHTIRMLPGVSGTWPSQGFLALVRCSCFELFMCSSKALGQMCYMNEEIYKYRFWLKERTRAWVTGVARWAFKDC